MNNIVKYIFCMLTALLMVSCQEQEILHSDDQEGYITLRFMMDVAVQDNIWTKAVDPDGGGVQQMQVFCFDANGIFITTVKAKLNHDTPDDGSTVSMSGTVEVSVPEHAEILQLVGILFLVDVHVDVSLFCYFECVGQFKAMAASDSKTCYQLIQIG